MSSNLFDMVRLLNARISALEGNLVKLEEKTEDSLNAIKGQMIRMKTGTEVSNDMISSGRRYGDLSPDKAFKIYKNPNTDFVIIDVSDKNYQPVKEMTPSIKIPLEELANRIHEIPSKTTLLLVVSEDGVRSILASELLVNCGYLNVNNVSGGHKYWPGNRLKEQQTA